MKSFSGSDLEALRCNAATGRGFNKLGFHGAALRGCEWHSLQHCTEWKTNKQTPICFFYWGGRGGICVKMNQTNVGTRSDWPSSKWRAFHGDLLLGFSDCHHQRWASVFLRHAHRAASSLRRLALYLSSSRVSAAALQRFFRHRACAACGQEEGEGKDKHQQGNPGSASTITPALK